MQPAAPEPDTVPPLPEGAAVPETAPQRANQVIEDYVLLAMGCGFIPSAVVDMLVVTALEVRMIHELARVYGAEFPHALVSVKIAVSLAGSVGPVYLSNKLKNTVKAIPGVGHLASISLLAVVNGASVYAVGKVFQRHFESGGTFLSTDNEFLRSYFEERYEEGRRLAPELAARA